MKPIQYISSQYEEGISLREDIYRTQFSVILREKTIVDQQDSILIKQKFESISHAIFFIEKFIKTKNCFNNKFKAHDVAILDRYQEKVVCGEIAYNEQSINWFRPVSSSYEIDSLLDTQSTLYEKARYEYFYDESRVFGNLLVESAERLNNFLCSKKYVNCQEIKTLTFRFHYPNILI